MMELDMGGLGGITGTISTGAPVQHVLVRLSACDFIRLHGVRHVSRGTTSSVCVFVGDMWIC